MSIYKRPSPVSDLKPLSRQSLTVDDLPWKVKQPTDITPFLKAGGAVKKLKIGQSAELEMNFNPYPWILSEDNPARQVGLLRTLK